MTNLACYHRTIMLCLFLTVLGTRSSLSDVSAVPSPELLASSVIIYSGPMRTLPCKNGVGLGCGATGSGFYFSNTTDGEPTGLIFTNKHVTRGRDVVTIFVPGYPKLYDDYTYEQISRVLVNKYDDDQTWSGGLGQDCGAIPFLLDSENVFPTRRIGSPTKRIGRVIVGRVIAEHNTRDVAVIQACSVGVTALAAHGDCTGLRHNEPLQLMGSSKHYGHASWLIGSLISCNEDRIVVLAPNEAGRSGGPVLTMDGIVIGIHWAIDENDLSYAVPIQKAIDLVDALEEAVKIVRIESRVTETMNVWIRCDPEDAWTADTLSENDALIVECRTQPRLTSGSDILLRYDDPFTTETTYEEIELKAQYRLVVPSSLGGTDIKYYYDARWFEFAYVPGTRDRISLNHSWRRVTVRRPGD